MTTLKSYRELIVWQKSISLVKMIYTSTQHFPKEEIYGLTSQIRRAAVSIPANIAEGQARNTTGEFIQFPGIAKGSLAELETLLILSENLNYMQKEVSENLLRDCEEISRLLSGLKKSLSTHH
ncbi:MAG: diversity-generating retroelement protein bAvd family protein [Ignavibacteria bacterium CG22_combo_CG10-13_8_21_14_all_37_15]|nr:MAG: diversity-generating retroelement protein bAvd family protein [Ignavibacteria bacterium CG22_combo_CG10-13_8_21_14_all_37_15]